MATGRRILVPLAGIVGLVALTASSALYFGRSNASVGSTQLADRLLPPMTEPALFEYRARMNRLPPAGPEREAWLAELRRSTAEAVAADPARFESHYQQAQAALLSGDDEGALRAFQEAVRRNPQNPDALAALEETARNLGRDRLAAETRAHRCRIDPAPDCS